MVFETVEKLVLFHYMLKLTDIAVPVVIAQHFNCLIVEMYVFIVPLVKHITEIIYKVRYLLFPFL